MTAKAPENETPAATDAAVDGGAAPPPQAPEAAAEILGIPYDEVTQVALIPIAYTKGTEFKPAPRKPMDDIVHFETW